MDDRYLRWLSCLYFNKLSKGQVVWTKEPRSINVDEIRRLMKIDSLEVVSIEGGICRLSNSQSHTD